MSSSVVTLANELCWTESTVVLMSDAVVIVFVLSTSSLTFISMLNEQDCDGVSLAPLRVKLAGTTSKPLSTNGAKVNDDPTPQASVAGVVAAVANSIGKLIFKPVLVAVNAVLGLATMTSSVAVPLGLTTISRYERVTVGARLTNKVSRAKSTLNGVAFKSPVRLLVTTS